MSPRKTAPAVPTPVLFVHGMWLHASSWQRWVDLFADAGFDAVAPAWPGEHPTVARTRAEPSAAAGLGMEQLVTSYAELIRSMPAEPVLVGHSLGGTVVQKLLSAGYGAGGVLLDSARFDGNLPGALPALRLGLPALADPARLDAVIGLTDYQFRFTFGRTLDPAESDRIFREYAIPSPARLLLQPEVAGIGLPAAPGGTPKAAPLLVLESAAGGAGAAPTAGSLVGGRHPLSDPADASVETRRFPDRGASFLLDDGWRDVAECALEWVQQRFGTARDDVRGVTLRGTAA